jgi:valyl-tRNA synthetase
MVMGRDLLFFWATRMIMFGVYKTHVVPFQHLYFTGLARDKEGHKMSKSKGNASDVLEMIERFGADAVRLSVTLGTTPGLDFRLYEEKIESFRNFANKLWNIGRYIASNQSTGDAASSKPKSNADLWILKRTEDTVREVTRLLENRLPSLAGETLRDFTWNEFADWYVEIHKAEKNDTVLCFVFETLLKLWHPFMPFVTEALYQHRISDHSDAEQFLMVARWPEGLPTKMTPEESAHAQRFQLVIGLIQEIRALRNLYKISPAQHIVVLVEKGENERTLSEDNGELFKRLARISEIRIVDTAPEKKILVQSGLLRAFIDLEGVIDTDAERARIDKEKTEKIKYIGALEMKLDNQNFVERAKPEIVAAERAKLEEAKKQLADLEQQLASLS